MHHPGIFMRFVILAKESLTGICWSQSMSSSSIPNGRLGTSSKCSVHRLRTLALSVISDSPSALRKSEGQQD